MSKNGGSRQKIQVEADAGTMSGNSEKWLPAEKESGKTSMNG